MDDDSIKEDLQSVMADDLNIKPKNLLWKLFALLVCIFLWPALVTFDAGDFPSPHQYPHNSPPENACGIAGAWCAFYLHNYFGDGAYPLLLFVTLAVLMKLFRSEIRSMPERLFGLTLLVICTSATVHLLPTNANAALPVGHGGVIGQALGDYLRVHLNPLGTFIVLSSCLFVGLLFTTDGWVLKLPFALRKMGEVSGCAIMYVRGLARSVAKPVVATAGAAIGASSRGVSTVKQKPRARGRAKDRKVAMIEPDDDPALFDEEPLEEEVNETAVADEVEEVDQEIDGEDEEESSESFDGAKENEDAANGATPKRGKKRKKSRGPVVNFLSPKQQPKEAYPKQIENWTLPPVDLLNEPEYGFTSQQELIVREQAKILEQTLQEFRLDARVVEIDTGPVITMFELTLGAGIKVSQIASLSNDIARALKAHAIRVVAPIPGKNTVGIEVPNIQKETVRLRELMTHGGKRAVGMRLPLFLGKDAAGKPLIADLTKMPHLLIAGTTGSGKSVCINSIILSLLMTQRPDHVKLIMVDPKMVEMSQFKEVPHLMCPIVTDLTKAEKILEWATTKMEERYALLAECRVKNISEYNNLGPEGVFTRLNPGNDEERARISTTLPYVVIMIDELADLMMTSGKEIEHHLSRLAQKSRAVGIHIIVATQRPEAKVVTGLIKSNMPSRICFRVASRMDSRIVLDQNGGEVLMGQGDMLFLPPGTHKPLRCQGTFLGNEEVQAVLDDLASRAKPEFHPELVRLPTAAQEAANTVRDPLFEKAVEIILETQRGSVSLLQRRLEIGYSRASRLVDQMADAGIVGEYKGSQAREVVMTVDEWRALQKQVAVDMEAGYVADEDGDLFGEEDEEHAETSYDEDAGEDAEEYDEDYEEEGTGK